jgi:hypothetical protein
LRGRKRPYGRKTWLICDQSHRQQFINRQQGRFQAEGVLSFGGFQ